MLTEGELGVCYRELRDEAEQLAGRNGDLAQRATVYHHLYHHSRGNHVFPLIAAHGALWARGYFAFGTRLGWWLSWLSLISTTSRQRKRELLDDFADAFRNVNRLVCIETYTTYHFSALHGAHPAAYKWIPPTLLTQLNRVHQARVLKTSLSASEKREVFHAFFLNEQATVVGPRINAAGKCFHWPLMRSLALMPHVRFAYMSGWGLQFWNFCNEAQRVKNGMQACDIALEVGLKKVEQTLEEYCVLPPQFVANSHQHFQSVCQHALANEFKTVVDSKSQPTLSTT
jgi:hypothetical protein